MANRRQQLVLLLNSGAADPLADYLATVTSYSPLAFYDANGSDLWQDSAGTTPAASNGDPIGRWDDLSGNGHHATQTTAGSKPALLSSGINGKAAIDPDGTADSLVVPFTSVSSSYTFYFVVDLKAADLSSSSSYILDSAVGRFILGFETGDPNKWSWFDGAWHNPSAGTESAGLKIVSVVLQSGGNGTIYRNNTSLGSEAYTARAIGSNTRLFSNNAGGGAFFTSPTSALAVFTSAHNTATREAIQSAMNTYYGGIF